MTVYRFDEIGTLFTAKVQKRLEVATRAAVLDLMDTAQAPAATGGRMPVKTGRLQRSLTSQVDNGQPVTGADSHRQVLSQIKPGSVFTAYWSTGYETLAHYGGEGRPAMLWRDVAIEQFPDMVKAAIAEAKKLVP